MTTGSKHLFLKLIEACKRKDLKTIQGIIEERPKLLYCQDRYHRNVLHYAVVLVLDNQNRLDEGDERKWSAGGAKSVSENTQVPVEVRDKEQQQQHLISLRCLKCFRFLLDKCDQQCQRLEAGHQRLAKLWCQADLDGLTILHLAVISCNTLLVREILSCSQPLPTFDNNSNALQQQPPLLVNYLDKEHHSPLHWAVITNNLTCVKLLINCGGVQLAHQADLNGATPLHYATQTNDYPKYRQQLRQMLKNVTRSSSEAVETSDQDVGTESHLPLLSSENLSQIKGPLLASGMETTPVRSTPHVTRGQWVSADHGSQPETASCATGSDTNGQLDVLGYLVRLQGIDLECRDRDARTPLLWAASSGNKQAILLLIGAGADPLCQDANRLGALHCAASHGFIECLESLLSLASKRPQQAELRRQINQPDNLNCTPLFYAVLSGNIDCVELLLDRGAQHDWQDVKGRTAAHFAALKGQLSTLKLLEARGGNLWLANKQGDLPLHYAIKSGRQQVVAWLLEHSPYERAVNAINNAGRAPIHLAVMKNNPAMVEFLIRHGANLNQLVKVRDKTATATIKRRTSSGSALAGETGVGAHPWGPVPVPSRGYRYETALDMAHRLDQDDKSCLELLTRAGAQFAADVVSSRQGQISGNGLAGQGTATNVRSLFDMHAVDPASPIGFDTSASSAEPQTVPKLPARPAPVVASLAHQSDSTGSSALSQSSLTSVRGLGGERVGVCHNIGQQQQQQSRSVKTDSGNRRQQQQQRWAETPLNEEQRTGSQSATRNRTGPYRGGMKYQNEHISASIKCKLYGNTVNQIQASSHSPHHQARSFPSLTERPVGGGAQKYHSAGIERPQSRQQEIITHVNVFASPVQHCTCSGQSGHLQSMADLCTCDHCQVHSGQHLRSGAGERVRTGPKVDGSRTQRRSSGEGSRHYASDVTTTTDSDDVTSDTIYDGDSEEHVMAGGGRHYLPNLGASNEPAAGQRSSGDPQQQPPLRYVPPSQACAQHLPVILSAEEERSTSGETTVNSGGGGEGGKQVFGTPTGDEIQLTPVSPLYEQDTVVAGSGAAAPLLASAAQDELRFDRSNRGGGHAGATLARRYREQVTSPVAEYIHQRTVDQRPLPAGGRISDARGWQHQQQQQKLDYSQVKAKVDSHRNDSGLSSHFGDDLDYFSGRRSKSWSTLSSSGGGAPRAGQIQLHQTPATNGQQHHHHSKSPLRHVHHHHHQQHQHQRQAVGGAKAMHRGSVDSVELASSVERTIRKYKQETKLFEELQNLKRSQIRSGRANEALLVKRLVERFRHDAQQADALIGLEAYSGPYTYKAYELYLYDQLRKLSKSNRAKLFGSREPQKSTNTDSDTAAAAAAADSSKGRQDVGDVEDEDSERNARDYLEEDLRAEYELQRVINRSEHDLVQSHMAKEATGDVIVTDPVIDSEELDNLSEQRQRSGSGQPIKQVERELIHRDSVGEDIQSEASSVGQSARRLEDGSERGRAGSENKIESDFAGDTDKEAQKEEGEDSTSTVKQPSLQQEPEVSASGGQYISSTSSSRRSSVDIEREKLDKLPLRVIGAGDELGEVATQLREAAQEDEDSNLTDRLADEKQQLEMQASELSSAIITDALGNISRVGSRAGSRPDSPLVRGQEQAEAGAASSSQESTSDHHKVAASEDTSDIAQAIESEIRSDDGETAASERKNADQEETNVKTLERGAEEIEEDTKPTRAYGARRRSVVNIGNKMEVIYHNVGIEIGPVADGDRNSEDGEDKSAQRRVDETAGDDAITYDVRDGRPIVCQLDRVEEGDRVEQDEEEAAGGGSKSTIEKRASVDDDTTSKDASQISDAEADDGPVEMQRRASSPPSPESKRIARLARTGADRSSQLASASTRHSSISGTTDSVDVASIQRKKVFNGYDLEKFHSRRAKRLIGGDRSLTGQVAANKDEEETLDNQAEIGAKVVGSKPFKRRQSRLRRSRLPRGPYKVVIPIGLIRERWNEIKQQERIRLREMSSRRELEQSFIPTQPAEGSKLRDVQRLSHTKSQPSLEERARQLSALSNELDDCCSNFTLIYEINKSFGQRNQQQKGRMIDSSKHQLNWCQRKLTKIVDVRTLKRTLSLPESYLYSNDLLKRFNILKL